MCPVVREYVCPVIPCSSNFSRTGFLLRIQDGFGFSSWALIMTASSFLAVLKRLSSLLKLFNRLCPAVELLLKVLVLLNQPNDNVEISMNGLLSLSDFFI